MNIGIVLLLVAPLCAQDLSPSDTVVPPSPRAVELRQVILSGERGATIEKVALLAEGCRGWIQERSSERVELRIPKDSLPGFESRLAALGRRVERRFSSTDLARDFENSLAGLGARVRLLETWSSMMSEAKDPKSVLDIQKEMADLAVEIDRRRGTLALLRNRVEYARVVFDFRFEGRSVSDRAGKTAFPWLNRLDLYCFQESFR